MAQEFYDDGNPGLYRTQDEERGSDFIELTRNGVYEKTHQAQISENSQYQAGILTNPSRLGQSQVLGSSSESIENCQSLSQPALPQSVRYQDRKRQYVKPKDVNLPACRSPIQSPRQPLPFTQNEDTQYESHHHPQAGIPGQTSHRILPTKPQFTNFRPYGGFSTGHEALRVAREWDNEYLSEGQGDGTDSHTNPNEELTEVPIVDFDRFVEDGRPNPNARKSQLRAEYFEDGNATSQDCEHEVVRYNNMRARKLNELSNDSNIGFLEPSPRVKNIRRGNRTLQNIKLGIPGDTNLGAKDVNTSDLAHSVLPSILENLEDGGEEEERTYNENYSRISAAKDSLAMIGNGPATAGTLETVGNRVGTATWEGYHKAMHRRGDHPARKIRKLMPRTEEGDASERHYNELLPAGGYGLAASDNLHSNYGAEGDASVRRYKDFLLGGGYKLDASDQPPSESGAACAADTNQNSQTADQSDSSNEQPRQIPGTMENYPLTSNLDLNNKPHPSNFTNTHGDQNHAPGVQPHIQIPRLGQNPTSDTILPSIEPDIAEGNYNTAPPYNIPRNQVGLSHLNGIYSTEAYPAFWGMSLNTAAPDSLSLYAKRLGNQIEAEVKAVLMGQPAGKDQNPPIPFFDPNLVPQGTIAHHYAREYIARLITTSQAALKGEVNDDPGFLQMPLSADKPCEKPSFFPATFLPPGPQPGQPQGTLPDPISSSKGLGGVPNFPQRLIYKPKDNNMPFSGQVDRSKFRRPMPRGPSPNPIGLPRAFSPPKALGPGIKDYDFNCSEVTLPLDFNTREEIKRRLIAKYEISKTKRSRCSMCGYLGHASNWKGCPEQRCVLCGKRGHGEKFCPWAEPDRRLRQAIERDQHASEDQAREKSPGILSPRSLVRKRHRLADENHVGIIAEDVRAPVAQMTAQMNEGQMRAPVTQITPRINEEELMAPLDTSQMITSTTKYNWPYANINGPERQSMVISLENTPNIASNMNYRRPYANGNRPERQPVISTFDQTQDIATTTENNWHYANISNPAWQPMGNPFENNQKIASQPLDITGMETILQETGVNSDSMMNQQRYSYDLGVRRYAGINEESMRAPIPVARMTTGPMDSSFHDTQHIASTTNVNWPSASIDTLEQQKLNDTRIGTQRQEAGVGADKMMGQQGSRQDSEASHDSYSTHDSCSSYDPGSSHNSENRQSPEDRLDGQGEPPDSRAASVEGTGDTGVGTQIQDTEIHADMGMDQQGHPHDAHDSGSSYDPGSSHDSENRQSQEDRLDNQGEPSELNGSRAASVEGTGDTGVDTRIQDTDTLADMGMDQHGHGRDLSEYDLFGLDWGNLDELPWPDVYDINSERQ